MENVNDSGYTFVNNNLDCFLDDLTSKLSVPSKEPRACALTHLSASSESSRKHRGAYSTLVTREFEGPKSISCFDYEIKLQSPVVNSIKTEFAQEPCGLKNIKVLTDLRFPPRLKSCYVKNYDFEKEDLEQIKVRRRGRRKQRRTRYSLSENVQVTDDNHQRNNLLPTDEDLRTVHDKIFRCRAIPYVFGCAENSASDCSASCASKVKGFRLFMEIPQDVRRLPPIVLENFEKIRNDSGVVDGASAMLAVTAVRTSAPSASRIFVPVSQDLAEKIETLSEVFEVDDEPVVEDSEVCRVVEDIVAFVDKQSDFPDLDFDPDVQLDNSLPTDDITEDACAKKDEVAENLDTVPQKQDPLNEDGNSQSQDGVSQSAENSPTRVRKKKRIEKNKVVRELKKLLNISVKDEDDGEMNAREETCEEPSCVLGCVCVSLKVKPPPTEHCGRVECIFKCSCADKKYLYVVGGDLAKEEKSWHQTVVRKKGNAIELKGTLERSKRKPKLPSKYTDTFTGQHFDRVVLPRKNARDGAKLDQDLAAELEKFRNNNRSNRRRRRIQDGSISINTRPIADPENKGEEADVVLTSKRLSTESTPRTQSEPSKRTFDDITNDLLKSRLAVCGTDQAKTLEDVFIWCTTHDKYDCHCSNYIVLTRNSNLLLKAARTNRYTAKRQLSSKSLVVVESPENRQVKLWDEKHCARSYGAVVNYRLRNKTGVYKRMMRRVLVDNGVSSYSNGFLKTKPVATVMPDELYPNMPLSHFPSCGVGTITNLFTGENIIVEHVDLSNETDDEDDKRLANKPEKNEPFEDTMDLSDDEDGCKQETGLVDLGSEIIPKPKKRSSGPFNPCFSMCTNTEKKMRLSRNSVAPPKGLPKQKPAPVIDVDTPVDLDIDSNDSDVEFIDDPMEVLSIKSSSDDDDCEEPKCVASGGSQPSPAKTNMKHLALPIDSKATCAKADSPITIESDDDDRPAAVEEPGNSSRGKRDSTSTNSSAVGGTDGSHSNDDYPTFGLCNLLNKQYGYVPLLEDAGGELQIKIPGSNHCSRTFTDAKEATKFMTGLVEKYLRITRTNQSGDWHKVTRGVLKALDIKKFPNPELLTQPVPPSSSRANAESAAKGGKSSDEATSKLAKKKLQAPLPSSTVVGTFSNMSEAHSFLNSNFPSLVPIQSRQVFRAPLPTVSYSSLNAPSPLVDTSARPPPKDARLQKGVFIPVAPNVMGAKLSSGAPSLVRMTNGKIITCSILPTATTSGPSQNVGQLPTASPTAAQSAGVNSGGPAHTGKTSGMTLKTAPSAAPRPPLAQSQATVQSVEGATVSKVQPTSPPLKTVPNGLVHGNVAVSKPEPAKPVIFGFTSATNFKSLLPQKSLSKT